MGDPNQGSTSSNTTNNRRRRSREIETLSLEIRNYPRDLLHSFISMNPNTSNQQSIESAMEEQGGEVEEPELNQGLSFGGDKSRRGLVRASSIAREIPCLRDGEEEEMVAPETTKAAAPARTSSLPTVTEEEWRRRKVTLRRMEAKRRRFEKQRSLKENSVVGGAGEGRESGSHLNLHSCSSNLCCAAT